MARPRKWLLLSALLTVCACGDRLAGTEVGNPEFTVAARFGIVDTDASASIPEMNLKVMGLGWTVGKDSAACWNEPEGHMVDFAADAPAPLPAVTVRKADWSRAEMLLQAPSEDQAPPGNATLPDSVPFSDWSDPRYIKLVKITSADTVRALFRMPPDLRIRLGFGKAAIGAWRKDADITVTVMFDAGKWAAGLGAQAGFAFREDGKHARYVLLSPEENVPVYAAMKASLPGCFMADAADML
ncbi:MAG TPA: hypothetical protein VJ385_04530 [Fibrobacteria bacterium]|nr:hypothetical protein [Fibrobacteria bacterium]